MWIRNSGSALVIRNNTILAGNHAEVGPNCGSGVRSTGHNLLGDLPAVQKNAEVLRISPQGAHTRKIIELFRAALDGSMTPTDALGASREWMVEEPCNGFWHGRAGVEQYVAA